jgi:hypothetical protein
MKRPSGRIVPCRDVRQSLRSKKPRNNFPPFSDALEKHSTLLRPLLVSRPLAVLR